MDNLLALVVFGNCYCHRISGTWGEPVDTAANMLGLLWNRRRHTSQVWERMGRDDCPMCQLRNIVKQNKPEEQNFHQKGARKFVHQVGKGVNPVVFILLITSCANLAFSEGNLGVSLGVFPAYNLSSNSGLGKMEEEKIVFWPDLAFRLAGATEFRPRVRGSVNPVAFSFSNYDLCKVGILREQFGYSP